MSTAPDYSHPHTVLGAMVWLMSHSAYHRQWSAHAFNVDIVPAVVLNQFRVYHDDNGNPVGFATWAFTSTQVRDGLIARTHTLQFDDWRSGDQLLFNDFVAPWGQGVAIVNDLRTNIFPDREAYSLSRNLDGSIRKVQRWRGKARLRQPEQPEVATQPPVPNFSAGALKTRVPA